MMIKMLLLFFFGFFSTFIYSQKVLIELPAIKNKLQTEFQKVTFNNINSSFQMPLETEPFRITPKEFFAYNIKDEGSKLCITTWNYSRIRPIVIPKDVVFYFHIKSGLNNIHVNWYCLDSMQDFKILYNHNEIRKFKRDFDKSDDLNISKIRNLKDCCYFSKIYESQNDVAELSKVNYIVKPLRSVFHNDWFIPLGLCTVASIGLSFYFNDKKNEQYSKYYQHRNNNTYFSKSRSFRNKQYCASGLSVLLPVAFCLNYSINWKNEKTN